MYAAAKDRFTSGSQRCGAVDSSRYFPVPRMLCDGYSVGLADSQSSIAYINASWSAKYELRMSQDICSQHADT
jgi:hypothetical protein